MELLDNFFKRQSAYFSWVKPKGGCVGFVRYSGIMVRWWQPLGLQAYLVSAKKLVES